MSVLVCALAAAWAQPEPQPATQDALPPARVQLAPLPASARFSKPVAFSTRPAGESLDALIQALARSVGLSAITQANPNRFVRCGTSY